MPKRKKRKTLSSTGKFVDVDYATGLLIRLLAIDGVAGFEANRCALMMEEANKIGVPAGLIRYDTAH